MNKTNRKLYLVGGKDRAIFVARSTEGQAIQFSSIRRRLTWRHGDNDTTIKTNGKLYLAGGKDRAFFCRTINWRASDTVFLDSTIRLPWRHGDNDTTITTNGKLYLAGGKDRALFVGRSTGGQAIQFSSIRRQLPWRHGDNDTTNKTNGKLYLAGGKDRALFVGRSTGGQAIQFSSIRQQLPWRHGDNDTTNKTNGKLYLAGGKDRALFVGRSTGGQAIQFSSIRRYDYLGDMATTTRRSRPMENCIWLGVRIGHFFVGRSTGGQAIQFSSIRRRLPWRHGDNDTTITTNGKLYLAGGKDRAFFCRTINWRASDTVFLDSTTTTLAIWRQRHDDQDQWKTVSGWG
ncbi:hypothetical protein BDC45DRAFT_610065 [Circinella umbellata]|nr:hypothetical protein BDC45DRAFT_610065 [Circinella umbellata]